jgi:hypothetical protein
MGINREDPHYQKKKLASMLVGSPMWVDFLKPTLEQRAKSSSITAITSMDMAFTMANRLAEKEYASYLISSIERLASDFVNNGDGTP